MEMEVQRSLGRVEAGITALTGRMDTFIASQVAQTEGIKDDVDGLGERVNKLETWKAYVLGYMAGTVAVIAVLFSIVWRVIPLIGK